MEVGVEAARRHELVVGAVLDDPALAQHDDEVGVLHRRDAVDTRNVVRPRRTLPQALEDLLLGLGVDGGERVVEDEDARVDGERAREGGALLLPAGERDARARRPSSRSPAGSSRTSFASWADLRRPLHARSASGSPRTPKATFSRTVSEKRKLSCGTKPTAPRSDGERDAPHVVAVDEERPRGRVPQAREEAHERRLAGAGRADDRDGGARGHREVDLVEHGRPVAVGEAQRAELDGAADLAHVERRLVADLATGASRIAWMRLVDASPRSKRFTTQPSAIIGQLSIAR